MDRILRDGDSAEARLLMGATKMSVQDFAGALVDFKKAVELNPQLPDVYSYYGMALAATGDTPGAAVAFRKELESNPNDYTSNVQLGILLKQDQNYAEARQCFQRALRVRPGDAAVRYQLATLDLQDGRTEAGARRTGKTDQGDSAVRGGSCFAGHGVLPARSARKTATRSAPSCSG